MAERELARQPTIRDVAALAGVSKKTVSWVVNRTDTVSEKTRRTVQRAIDKLGFVPNLQARGLALRRNSLIALLHDFPSAQTVLGFQNGILDTIKDTDLALIVRPVDHRSENMTDDVRGFLEKQRPAGVMLLPPLSDKEELIGLCTGLGIRHVRIGSAPNAGLDWVSSNDRQVVCATICRLIGLGHRRIGFIRGPEGFRLSREREAGFIDAMAQAGLPILDELVSVGGDRAASGVKACELFLRLPEPPSAIFCSNDEIAAGVIQGAHNMGVRVPDQLSVIGFDDIPAAAQLWPPLSTIRWPVREMGAQAARMFLADLQGLTAQPRNDAVKILASTFVERQSMGVCSTECVSLHRAMQPKSVATSMGFPEQPSRNRGAKRRCQPH